MTTELVEAVFFSLENDNRGDFNKIVSELYKFLKENDLSNNSIREVLQEFFLQKREYIFLEYGKTYGQVGIVVESLISNDENNNENNNGSNNQESNNNNQESNNNDEDNNDEDNNETYDESNISVLFTYYDSNTPYIQHGQLPIYNMGINTNIMNQPEMININNEITNIFQTMLQPSNQVLDNNINNLFNILMTMPVLNPQTMTDVKNVINTDELEKLEVKEYNMMNKEKYKECAICLEEYNDEDKVRILKCEHGYHKECIDKWLTNCNYKCPVCRDESNEHHAEI